MKHNKAKIPCIFLFTAIEKYTADGVTVWDVVRIIEDYIKAKTTTLILPLVGPG